MQGGNGPRASAGPLEGLGRGPVRCRGGVAAVHARVGLELADPLLYGAIALGFAIAYPFAFLANRYMIGRGKGHAVVHAYH